MFNLLLEETGTTLYMTFASTILAYAIGLPVGIALVVTGKSGIGKNTPVNIALGVGVNILRSIPFLILMLALKGFTEFLVGTIIGPTATIVSLVVAAAPFVARMVEASITEIDGGVIEAAQAMGANNWQIILKVMIPEAKPALLVGLAVSMITILGYSAMAGLIGGGGLGSVALNYGLYRFDAKTMWITIAVIVVLVQIIQELGMQIAKRTDNRI
ncbi:MAG: ABC transporter permease [Peptostreptococcaceae bacterium]|nr:ABC transporter permease [Peptostreptococcaceae bacterium]MDY5739308.1 methionine ABC transporter permease [Anaerovoracaceae bacterium]SFE44170.1 D-methionine transport system permease protein [Peptostreptococcaceae bacterium pGA-8]